VTNLYYDERLVKSVTLKACNMLLFCLSSAIVVDANNVQDILINDLLGSS
jgi:hypothetical protein